MQPSERQFLDPCQEAVATLYSFLDGELTDDRRQLISHHLEECGPCLHKYDFEAELKVVIARRCRDEVPEALRRRVAAALSEADCAAGLPGGLPGSAEGDGEKQ
jgi:mycothiol system anti-sigma-R factor